MQVLEFFTRLVQRVAPKHHFQAAQEVIVTRRFFENFSGDNVRYPFSRALGLGLGEGSGLAARLCV